MKFSIILIVAGIIIMIIGGIALMKTDNNVSQAKTTTESAFDFEQAAQAANNAYMNKPQLPLVNPTVVIFIGFIVAIAGAYDHYRTKDFPGKTK